MPVRKAAKNRVPGVQLFEDVLEQPDKIVPFTTDGIDSQIAQQQIVISQAVARKAMLEKRKSDAEKL